MTPSTVDTAFWRELQAMEAKSLSWIPLVEGAYLHVAQTKEAASKVVGVAHASSPARHRHHIAQVLWGNADSRHQHGA
jgi:dihydroxyacetone kinase DhaKLM complex PTS-EIIA-like component DhaM